MSAKPKDGESLFQKQDKLFTSNYYYILLTS